jgi:ABC-type cobalamin/Fe3+-siderophores transport system ATPase subunit
LGCTLAFFGGKLVRLRAIEVQDVLPVRQFKATDFSDVIVLAGPNGVGKTRLIQGILQKFQSPHGMSNIQFSIEATCEEERREWRTNFLSTSNPAECNLLFATLQKSKRRSRWQSSVIQFESDRSIQQIQPYQFSWNFADPFEEHMGWNYTLTPLKNRFQDTVHSIFRKVQSRRDEMARKAESLLKSGIKTMDLTVFSDPLLPFKKAFSQLLAPKELVEPDTQNQQLFYNFNNQQFVLNSLSSGETEVVNIVFDFLLRNPSDSIIVFDEPELHLHPELSYKLIQTLRDAGTNNQFIFCTHSSEIITASLDNTVVFVAPPREPPENQAIAVREDDETHQALKLLGQSIGIVSLGKKLVLIEGTHTSLDKQTYGAILKNRYPNLVLVPSEGKGLIRSFSSLMQAVLEKTIWGVEFYMVCDRDVIPPSKTKEDIEAEGKGRLRLLNKYHLENYFLDEKVLARVFSTMEPPGSPLTDPFEIQRSLKNIARKTISYAAALIVSAEHRDAVGNVDIMPGNCHDKSADELSALMVRRAKSESQRVALAIDATAIDTAVRRTVLELERSLEDGAGSWKRLMPGRQILNIFASQSKMTTGRLKLLYLREAESQEPNPFADIISIFEHFNSL